MLRYIFILLLSISSLFPFTIDKRVHKSNSFLLTSHYEVPRIMGYSIIGMALIEGNGNSRFGRTTFQALDSLIWANLTTEALKKTFRRVRPRYTDNPNKWFKNGNYSFPSGHVTSVTASVVPYILEYKDDYPLVHLLWLFPIQQMAGRVNAQAHWQTDVLAGFLVGSFWGWYAHSRKTPLFLYFDEDGIFTGLRYRF